MFIVGINAKLRHGKDEAGRPLIEDGYQNFTPSTELRALALILNPVVHWEDGAVVRVEDVEAWPGYEEAKDQFPEYRRFLQELGRATRTVFGPDVLLDAMKRRALGGDGDFVCTSMRYRNEADFCAEHGITIRVWRPGIPVESDHETETALDDYPFDYVVMNDGTIEDLHAKIREVVADGRRVWEARQALAGV